nr:MAG TPA_asm: hypothetical protein [Caudoviricetes sp.]
MIITTITLEYLLSINLMYFRVLTLAIQRLFIPTS